MKLCDRLKRSLLLLEFWWNSACDSWGIYKIVAVFLVCLAGICSYSKWLRILEGTYLRSCSLVGSCC